MANILGGIAVSHTPTIGFAVDHHKQQDPAWSPIFQSFEPLQRWLEEKKPDALVYIFNDHVTAFFFDHYSTFTLGIDSQYDVADEGGGPRCLPPVQGNAALSRHIGASLMADEFDMSFFMDKKLDHGLFSPLSALLPWDEAQGWPTAVIPLQIGVLQFPVPSARRCYKLGQALRRAIESFPEDINVAIVATGGLSHQVHGERCGFNNPDWDAQFVDMLVNDPEKLTVLLLQMVSLYRGGELVKMSKRTGQSVTLNELMEEVGTDAARYFFLMRSLDSQLDFDLDLAKKKSNDNPVYYIQYAHARVCSVLAQWAGDEAEFAQADLGRLDNPHELAVAAKLSEFPEVIEAAARDLAPHMVAFYLKDLAAAFHSYYNAERMLVDDPALRLARVTLAAAVRQTIRNGMGMLGVSCPQTM